jgi:hypothetical protein
MQTVQIKISYLLCRKPSIFAVVDQLQRRHKEKRQGAGQEIHSLFRQNRHELSLFTERP